MSCFEIFYLKSEYLFAIKENTMTEKLYNNDKRSPEMQAIIDEYSELINSLVLKRKRHPDREKKIIKILENEGAKLVTKFVSMNMPIIYYFKGFYYTINPCNLIAIRRLALTRKHNNTTVQLNLLQYDCELTSNYTAADHAITFSYD
jgi:hypothetical protein